MAQVMSPREQAFVLITCETGSEIHVAEQIKPLSGVKEVAMTRGTHDILVSIVAHDVESLKSTIEEKIRGIPGIRATTTLVIAGSL